MATTDMPELFAGAARALVTGQLELDEMGRDSFDAFDDTGVPPTVFTWSSCQVRVPVALRLRAKTAAGERTIAAITRGAGTTVTLRLRYVTSPQDVDDPRPQLPDEN